MNKTSSTTRTRWWNKKRIISAVLAVALLLGIFTAGTFAWNAISMNALNEAKADNILPGGRLHDDFNGQNKDVYVENYGTMPIYARIQLSEYMEIGDGAGLKGALQADGTYAVDPDNQATSLDSHSTISDPKTWDIHAPAADDPAVCPNVPGSDQFHDYWTWTMGGQKVYMPTFDKDKTSLATDITGLNTFGITSSDYQHNVTDPQANSNGANNIFGRDGSHDQYTVGQQITDTATYKGGVQKTETHTAQDTLPGSVMTMSDWVAGGCVPGPYWVYDADGWAYWAQAIQSGTATGLLLDQINLKAEMDDNWYYAINVVGQMASLNDIAQIDDGTTDGQHLIDVITRGTISSVTVNGVSSVQAGSTAKFTATVTGSNPNIDKSVTWTAIDAAGHPIPGVTIDADGTLHVSTAVPDGTQITVTATSVQDPTKSDSKTVTVNKAVPVVNSFTVEASGAATQAATSSNFILNMQASSSDQVINLTGAVTGSNLSDPVGTWSAAGASSAWADTSDNPCVVTIPKNSAGTITATFTVADDTSKKVTVTINVVAYTLFYSEGNMLYGSTTQDTTHTTTYADTINLTSPVGAATTRYFTTKNLTGGANYNIAAADWVLTSVSGDDLTGNVALSPVTTDQSYGVTIQPGFVGEFTLAIGGNYTVTFDVTANVAQSATVKVGETFTASGIEWRVLGKDGGQALIIAEHIQFDQRINGTISNWDTAITWANSELKESLNGEAGGVAPGSTWFAGLDNNFTSTIVPTTLKTKNGYNGSGGYDTLTSQKFFLLSEDEVFGTSSGGDASNNLFAGTTLFADNNSRKVTTLATSTLWWLRSPTVRDSTAAVIYSASGIVDKSTVNDTDGVRPACVVTLP